MRPKNNVEESSHDWRALMVRVPTEMHRALKVHAAIAGIPLREVYLAAFTLYAEKHGLKLR